MKWIRRLLSVVILSVLFIGGIVSLPIIIHGYMLYDEAIKMESIEEKVEVIQQQKDYRSVDEISEDFLAAIVSIEDHRFMDHGGADIISLGRALLTNIESGSFAEGGSTITQQLAKNMYFSQEKKLSRKIAELLVAMDLEKELSKEEILELYVNVIYYGDGYTGITEASQGYFGVEPDELTLSQATLVAGLPKAPSAYALSKHMDRALERQEQVVEAMVMQDYLNRQEAEAVLKE